LKRTVNGEAIWVLGIKKEKPIPPLFTHSRPLKGLPEQSDGNPNLKI